MRHDGTFHLRVKANSIHLCNLDNICYFWHLRSRKGCIVAVHPTNHIEGHCPMHEVHMVHPSSLLVSQGLFPLGSLWRCSVVHLLPHLPPSPLYPNCLTRNQAPYGSLSYVIITHPMPNYPTPIAVIREPFIHEMYPDWSNSPMVRIFSINNGFEMSIITQIRMTSPHSTLLAPISTSSVMPMESPINFSVYSFLAMKGRSFTLIQNGASLKSSLLVNPQIPLEG